MIDTVIYIKFRILILQFEFYIRDEENLNPGNNLFVTGLSMRTGDRELEDIFSKYGKVSYSINKNSIMRIYVCIIFLYFCTFVLFSNWSCLKYFIGLESPNYV